VEDRRDGDYNKGSKRDSNALRCLRTSETPLTRKMRRRKRVDKLEGRKYLGMKRMNHSELEEERLGETAVLFYTIQTENYLTHREREAQRKKKESSPMGQRVSSGPTTFNDGWKVIT